MTLRLARSLALGLLLCACETQAGRAPMPARAVAASRDWPVFVDGFLAGYFKANPSFAVNQGRHEFDGQLPDWSDSGLHSLVAWLGEQRARAQSFVAGGLDEAQRFEREYLVQRIDNDLFWLDRRRAALPQPGLLHRRAQPERLRRAALRDARAAPARLHPLCALGRERGPADPAQPAAAVARDLHALRRGAVRGSGGLLPQGRAPGLRGRGRRGPAAGARHGERGRRRCARGAGQAARRTTCRTRRPACRSDPRATPRCSR